METLPEKQETDLLHLWNNSKQAYDAIDIKTGAMHTVAKLELDKLEYSLQRADDICDLVRSGKTVVSIGKMEGMPTPARIYAWFSVYPEFRVRMIDARKHRGDYHFDKVINIAEKAEGALKDQIPGLKLAADIHRWAAEKSNPEIYGAKTEVTQKGGSAINITLHTGVLDTSLPSDIIVDEFGNFKGFSDGRGQTDLEVAGQASTSEIVELSRDRFKVIEEKQIEEEAKPEKEDMASMKEKQKALAAIMKKKKATAVPNENTYVATAHEQAMAGNEKAAMETMQYSVTNPARADIRAQDHAEVDEYLKKKRKENTK